MDYLGNIVGLFIHPDSTLRNIVKERRMDLAILVIVLYVVLQSLITYTLLSHIMVVNIPQTSYPPDVIQSWNSLADQLEQEMNKTFGPGNYTPPDRSYQYPQGPTQGTLAQLASSAILPAIIGISIVTLFIWLGISLGAHFLSKLIFDRKDWWNPDALVGVGYAFMVWIPILIIGLILLNLMPVYTIDSANATKGLDASLLNDIKNNMQFQLYHVVVFIGWVWFGILCILAIKNSDDLEFGQAVAVVGIPMFLLILYDQSRYIIEFLHYIL